MKKINDQIAFMLMLVMCFVSIQGTDVYAKTLALDLGEISSSTVQSYSEDEYQVRIPEDGNMFITASTVSGKVNVEVVPNDDLSTDLQRKYTVGTKESTNSMGVPSGLYKIHVSTAEGYKKAVYKLQVTFAPHISTSDVTYKVGTVTKNGKKIRAVKFTRIDDSVGVLKIQCSILNNGKTFALSHTGSTKTVTLSKTGHGSVNMKMQKVATINRKACKTKVISGTFKY